MMGTHVAPPVDIHMCTVYWVPLESEDTFSTVDVSSDEWYSWYALCLYNLMHFDKTIPKTHKGIYSILLKARVIIEESQSTTTFS